MASHIDPATGRNKRETGKLASYGKTRDRKGGAIRRQVGTGQPAERRIDQKRRIATQGRTRTQP